MKSATSNTLQRSVAPVRLPSLVSHSYFVPKQLAQIAPYIKNIKARCRDVDYRMIHKQMLTWLDSDIKRRTSDMVIVHASGETGPIGPPKNDR